MFEVFEWEDAGADQGAIWPADGNVHIEFTRVTDDQVIVHILTPEEATEVAHAIIAAAVAARGGQ